MRFKFIWFLILSVVLSSFVLSSIHNLAGFQSVDPLSNNCNEDKYMELAYPNDLDVTSSSGGVR